MNNQIKIFFPIIALFLVTKSIAQKIPEFGYVKGDTVKLYYNINQNLKIKIHESDPSMIRIKSSENRGVSISQADSSFFIYINNPINEIKLKLYYKNLPVDIINTRVEKLPASELRFEIAQNGEISKKKLSEVRKLLAEIPTKYRDDLNLEIYSYNLNIVKNNGAFEIISCFNNTLTDQAIKKLLSLPEDSQIIVSNVRLKTQQNNVIELEGEGLKYFIKY